MILWGVLNLCFTRSVLQEYVLQEYYKSMFTILFDKDLFQFINIKLVDRELPVTLRTLLLATKSSLNFHKLICYDLGPSA